MKTRKRIINVRKQSRITIPNENLWYFTEESSDNTTPESKIKSRKNDQASILNEDYKRYSLEKSGRNKNTKDCLFVVDWQMSDVF